MDIHKNRENIGIADR